MSTTRIISSKGLVWVHTNTQKCAHLLYTTFIYTKMQVISLHQIAYNLRVLFKKIYIFMNERKYILSNIVILLRLYSQISKRKYADLSRKTYFQLNAKQMYIPMWAQEISFIADDTLPRDIPENACYKDTYVVTLLECVLCIIIIPTWRHIRRRYN